MLMKHYPNKSNLYRSHAEIDMARDYSRLSRSHINCYSFVSCYCCLEFLYILVLNVALLGLASELIKIIVGYAFSIGSHMMNRKVWFITGITGTNQLCFVCL